MSAKNKALDFTESTIQEIAAHKQLVELLSVLKQFEAVFFYFENNLQPGFV